MLSVVVPIGGNCQYFVHTILGNISDTCGLGFNDFDMVFLTGSKINEQLELGFEEASKNFKFRVIRAPFESNMLLELLDWAFVNGNLSDWAFVQHMDTFWIPECLPWLTITKSIINGNPDLIAIGSFDDHKALLDGQKFTQFYDYCSAFNRQKFVDSNLSFMWGSLSELNLSPQVRECLENGRFTEHNYNKIKWLDGSVALGMEIAMRFPKSAVSKYNYNRLHVHPWAIIRPWLNIEKQKNKLLIRSHTRQDFYAESERYSKISYISSFHFDSKIPNQNIFPWKLFNELCPKYDLEHVKNDPLVKIMSKYYMPDNIVGAEKSMGISRVVFIGDPDEKIKIF